MSKRRQPERALSWDYAAGHRIPLHHHRTDQLVYARRGVMTLTTSAGTWVVPPHRAVWVPRRVEHAIVMSGPVEMRTLYLGGAALLPGFRVIEVSPLLRELILDAVTRGGLDGRRPLDRARRQLIASELMGSAGSGVHLPQPRDPRVRRVVDALRRDPAQPIDACLHGVSRRTLERLVLAETGLSLGRYARQLRLLGAMERLAAGVAVTRVAIECGYASPSAFIGAFRSAFGETPGRYFGRGVLGAGGP